MTNLVRLVTAFVVVTAAGVAAVAVGPSPGGPGEGRGTGDAAAAQIERTIDRPTKSALFAQADPVRFQVVDVYVDAGDKPLAAYQVSLAATAKNALLSGVEGGDHPAFNLPPYYDAKALIDETVIVAGLSTADELPRGRTRVARLHVQVTGPADPRYEAKLQVAAGPDGAALDAKVTVEASR